MNTNQLERAVLEDQDLFFLESVPFLYHCHHFNLFHDQTIDDALGEELGTTVRSTAAQAAAHQLVTQVTERHGLTSSAERLDAAATLFAWMGNGRLDLGDTEVLGEDLHYGHCWREKYGGKVKRLYPVDGFGAGYSAATREVAEGLPPGSITASETACIALRSPACKFELERIPNQAGEIRPVAQPEISEQAGATFGGQDEERVAGIAAKLRELVFAAGGDERGLLQAFGVYVTMQMSNYYNLSGYETLHRVEKGVPAAVPLVESLLREAGQVCVFHTFGNMLLSPEWEGAVGKLSGEVSDIVPFSTAIARSLGFGRWSVQELVPGERMVLRAPTTYEAPFYLAQYGRSPAPRCYFFQGASLAIMLLAHAVDWTSRPELTDDFYVSLFRSGKIPWKVEETHCRARGDEFCETVVTAA